VSWAATKVEKGYMKHLNLQSTYLCFDSIITAVGDTCHNI